ncbi:phosphotransferase family protein [Paenibacillus sp. NFR01]|uniref:phosphotransferase family protein n=1 Tax=Paenibacillus sp. NFR01 TaxID=1566279 RepID=UPI0008BA5BE5|nr:aminoglycoside phosphotransferase family protein [Paenibacillus sp. NFR01]SET09870.1 Predicted kinase, aminoglycoside phosphotransferase (APT) family [Paenibacillus sp. NFR01]
MPVSSTKNNKTEAEIKVMCAQAKLGAVARITELTEGFFNVAYGITTMEGKEYILKIAPHPATPVMTHEKNIMFSEVQSMELIRQNLDVPVAEILYYDDSRTVCNSDYFVMSRIPGQSFASITEQMTEKEIQAVNRSAGSYNREIHSLTHDRFGYFGQADKQGDNWFQVFRSMICDTLEDARRMNVDLKIADSDILRALDGEAEFFREVTEPRLVHWDIWAGNIFVQDGRITGIIDFERCLWGDVLMEVGFRTYGLSDDFLSGYGTGKLTPEQLKRAEWYDIYLFLIASMECDYRQYETRDSYNWGTDMLRQWMERKSQPGV